METRDDTNPEEIRTPSFAEGLAGLNEQGKACGRLEVAAEVMAIFGGKPYTGTLSQEEKRILDFCQKIVDKQGRLE